MISAVIWSVVVFAVVFVALDWAEKQIHRLRHNPDTSYRWGVWVFALLASIYSLITSLGR